MPPNSICPPAVSQPLLDATYCVVPPSAAGAKQARWAAALWDSGDVGGFECLVPKDDDQTAAEVYICI